MGETQTMPPGQSSVARKLAPISVLFQLAALARQSIFPLLVAGWSAFQGNLWIILGLLAATSVALAFILVRYFTLRYQISDGELIVTEGWIFRKVRNVPVDRIQNVDLVQTIWHRLFHVAEVRVETASGTEPEATLRVLSLNEIDRLRGEILTRSNRTAKPESAPPAMSAGARSTDAVTSDAVASGTITSGTITSGTITSGVGNKTVLTIPTNWLVKAGLASNRGLILFGIAFGYLSQQNTRWDQQFDQLARYLPGDVWMLNPWIAIPIAIVIALLVIRLLGIAWYVLRFSGYRLDRVGEDFHVSCGLLTKVSATVPRRRIQFISIHRTPLMRMMKLASIRIETAGGAGKQREDAASTVTRRWFVPVISTDRIAEVLDEIRPGLTVDEAATDWMPASPRAGRRWLRKAVFISIAAAGIGYAVAGVGGIACGPIAGIAVAVWARKHLEVLGYHRFEDGVMFRSGAWNRKTSVTFFDRIQSLEVTTTPFDRRWSMGRLSIDTAAAGPADHTIAFPMMEIEVARQEFVVLSQHSANVSMNWA
ncbi:Bacterial membrane flanked domain protein [Rubripirellula tenax]|uniref:Bacterial membrane flanked domain protein n=1 Tax=Rubripirellula tenax TaxID=2528015 RepID=A0A5C6FB39_9BACT|nr:PH domain-containing protein [Rubripirellula tenax]TWU56801.1 Bacterial membrane flanked domain protein [Rubripirellula tenax]